MILYISLFFFGIFFSSFPQGNFDLSRELFYFTSFFVVMIKLKSICLFLCEEFLGESGQWINLIYSCVESYVDLVSRYCSIQRTAHISLSLLTYTTSYLDKKNRSVNRYDEEYRFNKKIVNRIVHFRALSRSILSHVRN